MLTLSSICKVIKLSYFVGLKSTNPQWELYFQYDKISQTFVGTRTALFFYGLDFVFCTHALFDVYMQLVSSWTCRNQSLSLALIINGEAKTISWAAFWIPNFWLWVSFQYYIHINIFWIVLLHFFFWLIMPAVTCGYASLKKEIGKWVGWLQYLFGVAQKITWVGCFKI